MDRERGGVEGTLAFDDLAGVIHAEQGRHPHMAEVLADPVDPETIGMLRVAGGDVAGDSLVEAELREEPVGGREPLLPVEPFVVDVVERGHLENHGGLL